MWNKDKYIEFLSTRRLAPENRWKFYGMWIDRFLAHRGNAPSTSLDNAKVIGFLTHLAVERKVSKATQSQAFNALLFLFRNVLLRDLDVSSLAVRVRPSRRLPVVLSREEVSLLLAPA